MKEPTTMDIKRKLKAGNYSYLGHTGTAIIKTLLSRLEAAGNLPAKWHNEPDTCNTYGTERGATRTTCANELLNAIGEYDQL